jgi:hypothetical protein
MASAAPSPGGSRRASSQSARRSRSTVILLLISLRPEQWTKNLIVFAGALFGGQLTSAPAVAAAGGAFAIFCALSGAVYLFNDVADRAADQRHPLKRERPIASGELSPAFAVTVALILALTGVGAAFAIRPLLGAVAAAYFALLFVYSFVLKHLVCTTLLALFLSFSKRRHELTLLAEGAIDHRPILHEYSPYLLDQMIAVVSASTLVAYTLYATSAETAQRLGTTRLGLTIPFVLYGIFRYLYLVHQKQGGGSPTTLLVTDGPLLACVGLWSLAVAVILYTPLGR